MAVLNDIDRFHLVADVLELVPRLGSCPAYVKQLMRDKRIEHRQYIRAHGDLPGIHAWQWGGGRAAR